MIKMMLNVKYILLILINAKKRKKFNYINEQLNSFEKRCNI